MRLRVLTYNVHKCIGGVDRRYEPARVRDVISHYEPDVVMLQEVDAGAKRSLRHEQVELLGNGLGLRHRAWFANVRIRGGGAYGNALLSRFPLVRTENIDLTVPPKKRRSVLHATARVRLGRKTRTVHFFNAHLGLLGVERVTQLKRFLASHPFRGLHANTPVVLAGDFNDVWGNLGSKVLGPGGFSGGCSVKTFPAYAPVRALDGLFVRGRVRVEHVHAGRIALAKAASDHLPLVADLSLR